KFYPSEQGDTWVYADLMVESKTETGMVEVKNLRTASSQAIKELRQRFVNSGRELHWLKDGSKVSKKTLVLHSKADVLEKIVEALSDTDVHVMSSWDFRQSIDVALKQLEKEGYMRTNVYSRDDLLRAYDMIVEKPHVLIRRCQEPKFRFIDMVTRELVERLQKDKKAEMPKPIETYSTQAKVAKNDCGRFMQWRIPLRSLPKSTIKRFIQKRIKNVPEDVLFFDLESTGWSTYPHQRNFIGKNLIFLNGLAYREKNDIMFELNFARNPFEEEPILRRLRELEKKSREIVTFNGRTYDYPVTKERFVANMMVNGLDDEKHTDLYNELVRSNARKRHNLASLKLRHLYELFDKDTREDIPGREIPLLYHNWLQNGQPSVIEKNLQHNVLDLMTLVAVYLSPRLRKR
ncbi:ribonuclease H-like domain-containing protein, partial [Candidatus Woesearchaeota archaeon]|nr:ribonuclease H-like domain-containing protein [Candidatus Woesearchaeota archaeon]